MFYTANITAYFNIRGSMFVLNSIFVRFLKIRTKIGFRFILITVNETTVKPLSL